MPPFFKPAAELPTELGRRRILASTAGVRVSPLQLGNMSLGSAWNERLGESTKEGAFALYDAYFEAGGNFIDTANLYQDEQAETWLGEWMAARGNRDALVVATKYTFDYRGHAHQADGGGADGRWTANHQGNHKRALRMSVRDSLAKLQTDYIDVLYVHAWDYTTSIKEVMDALEHLVAEGKVLYLGVSDTPAWVVSAANVYAAENGKTPFSIYQGRWSVLARDFERDIIPMARHFGMALAPWGALGGGRFQSAKQLQARGVEKLRGDGGLAEHEVRMSEALGKVAAEHGIDSVTAVALAYVMHKAPYVFFFFFFLVVLFLDRCVTDLFFPLNDRRVFPIVGGRKVEQLKENIQGLSLKLTDEQIAALEAVQSFDPGFPVDMIGHDPQVTGHSWIVSSATPISFPGARAT